MEPSRVRASGTILYEQRRFRFLLVSFPYFGLATIMVFVLAILILPTADPGTGALAGVAFTFVTVGAISLAPKRPLRLYENGIALPRWLNAFWRYAEVRDVQLFHPLGEGVRVNFMVITRQDGRNVTLRDLDLPKDFDQVASLVLRGFREYGATSALHWEPGAWVLVEDLMLRGILLVKVEQWARNHRLMTINEAAIREATSEDPKLRRQLALLSNLGRRAKRGPSATGSGSRSRP